MKTVVITGGTDGIGKGLALHYLGQGDHVIVIGNSPQKAAMLQQEAGNIDSRFTFLQADLSLIKENRRIAGELRKITDHIDLLFLCAYKFNQQRQSTKEGLEFMFALHYLSRYILSFDLVPLLTKAAEPMIVNVSGAGMNGKVKWDDLQSTNAYSPFKVTLQNSRLNDLLGVAFAQQSPRIKYILFNPVFVKTPGLLQGYSNPAIKFMVRVAASLFAKSVGQTVDTLSRILASQAQKSLTVYKQQKEIRLAGSTATESRRLREVTNNILGAST